MSSQVPEGWEIKKLGMIGRCVRGLTYSPDDVDDFGLLVLRSSNIQDGRLSFDDKVYVNIEVEEECLSKKNDIVICVRNGSKNLIGKSAVFLHDNLRATHGAFMTVFRSDSNYYVQHLLKSDKFFEFVSRDIGATINSINNGNLLEYRFLIPPIPEQQKIASILTAVDDVIESTQAQINKLKDLKTGMMQELLTKGIGHAEFKDSPVGRIPKAWNVKTLSQLVKKESPICYGILMPGTGVIGGVPVIKVKDIKENQINENDLLLTSKEIDEKYARSRVRSGDILLTIRGSTGRLAVVPTSLNGANITQDTARVRIDDGELSEFVFIYLQGASAQEQIESHTIGQAVKGINLEEVRKVLVALPPERERQSITSAISSVDKKLYFSFRKMQKLLDAKKALMQDLLTGKVRVKVN